ncbi:MAG TPA: hypothetical protein VFW31_06480 [Candidatus Angelobacter sp.]|nr:hypothetical protein [Candidatus Angelobacter sp.]
MTPDVSAGIDEIKAMFPNSAVIAEEDGEGGAYVTVVDIEIGSQYQPSVASCGFRISYLYPRADIYPHYIIGGISRRDGQARQGVQQVTWRNQQVLQLSRRSNKWNAAHDTAALKLAKVLEWFRKL